MAIDVDRITKAVGKVRKLLKKHGKLLTPEQVHDLRTRIRRFEASFRAIETNTSKCEKQLLDQLKVIRKKAGKVRDMDVLTSDALGLHTSDHQECVLRLVQYLGAERYRLAERLRLSIGKYGKKVRPQLKKTFRHIEKSLETDTRTAPQKNAATAALQLSANLASPARLNRRNLHPYRLKIKELRYVLQTAQEPANKRFLDALGASKNAIGEWHDWETLMIIARKVLDEESSCPVVEQMARISQNKYETALKITSKMRTEFLRPRGVRKTRRSQPKSLPTPALEAVSAIAS